MSERELEMVDKAIVRPRRARDGAEVAADLDAALDGVEVEHERPDGVLVRGGRAQLEALASSGARVKILRDTNLLRLGRHVIDTDAADPIAGVASRQRVPREHRASWPHHLVQLAGPPTPAWVAAVEDAGVEVVEPIGAYGLFVCGEPEAVETVAALPFVSWAGPFQPAWRVDDQLEGVRGTVDVRVGVCPPSAVDEVTAQLEEMDAQVVSVERADPGSARAGTLDRYAVITVTVSATAARNDVSRLPTVRFVEAAPPDELVDERSNQILTEGFQAGAAQGPTVTGYADELTDYGVDGDGVTIAVIDSGIDDHNTTTIHPDLRGRLAFFADQTGGSVPTDSNGHGTHVAAIAAGDGSTGDTDPQGFLLGQGIAPGAQVGSINSITGAATTTTAAWMTTAAQNGAAIANNSWTQTNSAGGAYTSRSATVDGAVRDPDTATSELERMSIVFAAANFGGGPSTIGVPQNGKNVVCVGNGLTSRPGELFLDDDVRGVYGSSSRGPAVDGRILPTVIAPGTDIISARSTIDASPGVAGVQQNRAAYTDSGGTAHNQHTRMTGTSQAAPHVAGAVALLVERWIARTGQRPSPALVRALLVNTAEDLAGGPSYHALRGGWVANGGNFQLTGFGFAPAQLVEASAAGWQTLTQVANVGAIANPGEWAYTAATDLVTVRTTNGNSPAGNTIDIHLLRGPLGNVPDNDQGWGRVSIENLLLSAPDSDRGPRIVVDERLGFTANGQEWTLRVAPVDPTRPMRITLAWTDAPGAANANPALVNDLDLEVTELDSGDVLLGNVFANGFSTTGGTADSLNNTECVYVQDPSGVYEVSVIASALRADARPPFGTASPWQDFAIVLDNAEVPSADSVDVALAIDRSGSMVSSGYVDTTRTAARGFVDLLTIDDGVGVASFGSTAQDEFPAAAPPGVRTITAQADRDAATAAIDGIGFGGMTEMGAGLQTAADMLAASTGTRAVVLMSDGYDNGSPDARTVAGGLASDIAVHTCAMGPASDQVLLDDIASSTGGLYLYMPTIDDLFLLLNVIREQVTGTGLVVNTAHTASESRVGAWVEEEAEEVTFLVNFDDPKLHWVPRDPTRSGVAVRLRTPSGRLLHPHEPTVRRTEGPGYVAFRVPEPPAGQWWVEVATARRTHTRYTVGGFVRSPISVDAALEGGLRGRPLDARVCVEAPGPGIELVRGTVCVTAPTRSKESAVVDLSRFLRGRRITTKLRGDLIPERFRRYVALERAMREERVAPIEHETRCVPMRGRGDGRDEVVLPPDGGPTIGGGGPTFGGGVVGGGGGRVTVGGGATGGTIVPIGGGSVVAEPIATRPSGELLRIDPRIRERLLHGLGRASSTACVSEQWPFTKVPGSYNATFVVHGSSAAGNRFVRTTTRSVRIR